MTDWDWDFSYELQLKEDEKEHINLKQSEEEKEYGDRHIKGSASWVFMVLGLVPIGLEGYCWYEVNNAKDLTFTEWEYTRNGMLISAGA